MTTDSGNQSETATPVGLRTDGHVDAETLAYARQKIDAAVDRPGLPRATGEARIAQAAAHHEGRPWKATADLRFGSRTVLATAEAATGREVVDLLQDRLRRQIDKAVHAATQGRRATAPPWRGGSASVAASAAPDEPQA
ncbi:hypothetical protein H9Y04_24865 [Streptomyces sp. TRM66268-LWL]|uniref:Uncharacterized protein n=1 Tax=Streptomyces polyasparticus TaxID=2767826 RepID=A0ABR7SN37_9ACTN|nr:hypothetical protein [Streptomyces polyasparticus]MBC9715778.1 hypothetical protein [Streptomyces polyasparticus]